MITTIKNWLNGLPTWALALIVVVAVVVGLFLLCIAIVAFFSSGFAATIVALGIMYYVVYDVIRAGRKVSR